MREISSKRITEATAELCRQAAYLLPAEVEEALNRALKMETSELGREVLREIIKNAEIARKEKLPLCQDTGFAVVFVDLGQEVLISGGQLTEAINEGVSRGFSDLRKSIVSDPFIRANTGDNTPAVVHIEIVPGDKLKLGLLLKGGGGENASTLKMFLPGAEKEEIVRFVVEKVKEAGPRACPPVIVGVGIGGTFDHAPFLAKKALRRKVGHLNSSHHIAELEKEMLKRINETGVGPMGLGGKTSALAVHIETFPCHIASLPVAVNLECHAHRYQEAVL
ncbi:fumarate hydratase [Candidatus Saganbacteria bacterium]|nr:fumarate hydratase [Candidatus Saganbacteria bacterium]